MDELETYKLVLETRLSRGMCKTSFILVLSCYRYQSFKVI